MFNLVTSSKQKQKLKMRKIKSPSFNFLLQPEKLRNKSHMYEAGTKFKIPSEMQLSLKAYNSVTISCKSRSITSQRITIVVCQTQTFQRESWQQPRGFSLTKGMLDCLNFLHTTLCNVWFLRTTVIFQCKNYHVEKIIISQLFFCNIGDL